jgi:hypothetical protein
VTHDRLSGRTWRCPKDQREVRQSDSDVSRPGVLLDIISGKSTRNQCKSLKSGGISFSELFQLFHLRAFFQMFCRIKRLRRQAARDGARGPLHMNRRLLATMRCVFKGCIYSCDSAYIRAGRHFVCAVSIVPVHW